MYTTADLTNNICTPPRLHCGGGLIRISHTGGNYTKQYSSIGGGCVIHLYVVYRGVVMLLVGKYSTQDRRHWINKLNPLRSTAV